MTNHTLFTSLALLFLSVLAVPVAAVPTQTGGPRVEARLSTGVTKLGAPVDRASVREPSSPSRAVPTPCQRRGRG